jgi:hypothetical protein
VDEELTYMCWFAPCQEPVLVEAIGTYEDVFGLEQTVPMALCDRHARIIQDNVVILRTA